MGQLHDALKESGYTGHRRHRTTAGYAHLANAHLVEAAERVGGFINEAMNSERSILQLSPAKPA